MSFSVKVFLLFVCFLPLSILIIGPCCTLRGAATGKILSVGFLWCSFRPDHGDFKCRLDTKSIVMKDFYSERGWGGLTVHVFKCML